MSSVPVVYELWSLLEASLLAQAKHLVRDIAQEQGADPKALWDRVRREVKLTPLELPDPVESTYCSYQLRDGVIAQKCLQPVLLGHTTCPQHSGRLSPAVPLNQFLPKVVRIQNEADPGDVYFQKVGTASNSNILYSSELKPVGILHEGKAIVFHVE
jgi:hypothetical protein